jgi:hypothetical protein
MSRLMADQESRGGDGDLGAGEEDSIMGVNLAEGCGAVNATPRRVEREARDRRERRDLKFEVLGSKFQNFEHQTSNPRVSPVPPVPQVSQVSHVSRGSCGELCWLDAFLYKNGCAAHRFSAFFLSV